MNNPPVNKKDCKIIGAFDQNIVNVIKIDLYDLLTINNYVFELWISPSLPKPYLTQALERRCYPGGAIMAPLVFSALGLPKAKNWILAHFWH